MEEGLIFPKPPLQEDHIFRVQTHDYGLPGPDFLYQFTDENFRGEVARMKRFMHKVRGNGDGEFHRCTRQFFSLLLLEARQIAGRLGHAAEDTLNGRALILDALLLAFV